MPVTGIDHINISGSFEMIERCRLFYTDILGLVSGFRPPFRTRGFWLYSSGGRVAIVHLTEREGTGESADGPFQHVAFRCADFDTMIVRLRDAAVPLQRDDVPTTGEIQLFLNDPAGVPIELNFAR
jgi:catechol 2,3-dioxygenase-like lactoylglutathione lyase family enzyme